MMYRSTRAAAAAVIVFSVLALGGCAKSISVSPREIVLTAEHPSEVVMVDMKWPHRVSWFLYNTAPDIIAVAPNMSDEWSGSVTVTATDFSAIRNEQVSFVMSHEPYLTAVLDVQIK